MTITTNDVQNSIKRTRKYGKRALAYAAAAAVLTSTTVASADFTGDYAPENWSATGTGSVTNDGLTATITGPDDGFQAEFAYSIEVLADGVIEFEWEYTNLLGDYGSYDYAGFLLDGDFTLLATNDDSLAAAAFGTESVAVTQGQTFAFAIASLDGQFGAGQLTVSGFAGPQSVPEPSALGLLAAGTIGGLLASRRRNS